MSNRFSELKPLTNKVVIYIPSTIEGNQPAPEELVRNLVSKTAAELSSITGGATIVPGARGCWVSDTLGLIEEDITRIESYTDNLTDELLDLVYSIGARLRDTLSQEAVSVELNNQLYFI